jgi:hypothetical protein
MDRFVEHPREWIVSEPCTAHAPLKREESASVSSGLYSFDLQQRLLMML